MANSPTKLKKKETLFSPAKKKSEIAVQTEADSYQRKMTVIKPTKTVRIDSETDVLEPLKQLSEQAPLIDKPFDPDAYKEDWMDSVIYKKAMT